MASGLRAARTKGLAAVLIFAGAFFSATAAPPYAGTPSVPQNITIINGTRTVMVALRVRESSADNWQPDILNRRSLGVQRQITVSLPEKSSCLVDIMATFEDGHHVTKSRVNLCKSATYLLTDF